MIVNTKMITKSYRKMIIKLKNCLRNKHKDWLLFLISHQGGGTAFALLPTLRFITCYALICRDKKSNGKLLIVIEFSDIRHKLKENLKNCSNKFKKKFTMMENPY